MMHIYTVKHDDVFIMYQNMMHILYHNLWCIFYTVKHDTIFYDDILYRKTYHILYHKLSYICINISDVYFVLVTCIIYDTGRYVHPTLAIQVTPITPTVEVVIKTATKEVTGLSEKVALLKGQNPPVLSLKATFECYREIPRFGRWHR